MFARRSGALAVILAVAALGAAGPALAQSQSTGTSITIPGLLTEAERILYGDQGEGAILERLVRLEEDVYGEPQPGALVTRINRIYGYLASGQFSGVSLKLRLNAVEWVVFQRLSEDLPLVRRLEQLETSILGAQQEGSVVERAEGLLSLVWPTGEMNVSRVELAKATVVRIRLLDEINSGRNEVGQTIRYEVAEDVLVEDRVVIPAGARGQARVRAVEAAGRLGRSGRVELDFGSVSALDGTQVRMQVSESAAQQNQDLAAVAGLAGVYLLGPPGLAAPYFVRGAEHVVPAGTQFYVEVDQAVQVTGLSLVPET